MPHTKQISNASVTLLYNSYRSFLEFKVLNGETLSLFGNSELTASLVPRPSHRSLCSLVRGRPGIKAR